MCSVRQAVIVIGVAVDREVVAAAVVVGVTACVWRVVRASGVIALCIYLTLLTYGFFRQLDK